MMNKLQVDLIIISVSIFLGLITLLFFLSFFILILILIRNGIRAKYARTGVQEISCRGKILMVSTIRERLDEFDATTITIIFLADRLVMLFRATPPLEALLCHQLVGLLFLQELMKDSCAMR